MHRTAALLEDARFPSERSQVCMLQHGSALAVSRRSAMPATAPSNGTDLLQRPGLLSSRSNSRALAAGGKLSHARGVRGHDDGTGAGRSSSINAGALSQRYSHINRSTYSLDAEQSLTASFNALQDSIQTHTSEDLQISREKEHNISIQGVANLVRDDIDWPSEISSKVHASLHAVHADGASTAGLTLKDNMHLRQPPRLALGMLASTSRNSGAKTKTASSSHVRLFDNSFRSRPPTSTSVHFSDRQGALKSSSNALQNNIMKHDGLSSAALKDSSGAQAGSELGGSSQGLSQENLSMQLVGAERALAAEFSSLAEDAMMHHPLGLPMSPRRQSIKGALAGKHTEETTRGAALVNSSAPSIDAEHALKASFVALQNSIKIQHSLKWEHLDLQRKAKAAEWEAAQTKAADERLLQQDMLIRQEDTRLRREDEKLRAENNELQQLVSQLTKADSEGKQVQQSSLASAWADGAPEISLLLSALLGSRAGHTEVAENKSQSRTSNKTLEAAIRSTGSSNAGSRDARTERAIILGAGAVGLFLAWIISNAASFFLYHAKDENGDGVIDFADFEEHMAHRVCCGLGASGARGVLGVVIIAGAGFAFLWWQGIIQPFLKELLCYVYLGAVVLLLVGVLLAELWETFKDVFLTQIHALQRLMRFFKIETGDINFDKHVGLGRKDGNADSDNPRSNFSCC